MCPGDEIGHVCTQAAVWHGPVARFGRYRPGVESVARRTLVVVIQPVYEWPSTPAAELQCARLRGQGELLSCVDSRLDEQWFGHADVSRLLFFECRCW